MSNYATLKAAIQDVIKTNGNNEITGPILQQTLVAMINSLGDGFQFKGIANSSTTPGTPDQNVFYIAGAGTYPNFNSAVIPDGYLGVFKYNGSWTIETTQVGKNYDSEIADLDNRINEILRGQTETYAKILVMNAYTGGKNVNAITGEIQDISAYPNMYVNEFPIDLINYEYLASYGTGATQGTFTLNYYDINWNYLGGAYNRESSGNVSTSLIMVPLVYPQEWQSDLQTFKERVAFIRIAGYTGLREATLYETWTIPQSILARPVTPNEIEIYATMIQTPMLRKITTSNTKINTTTVVSPWGIVWPETYSVSGAPTPIIAMLHGSDGFVADGVLGYTKTSWVTARNNYLAAGFAVMDINGYGISSQADDKSKHWGCPLAIETLDKAFEFLKQNFNVCEKLYLHGTSMGGILAESYAKCFPGKVAAIGLFAPNFFAYSIRFISDASKYPAWGYIDKAEAEADDYNQLTGYILFNECQIADNIDGSIKQFEWTDYNDDNRTEILTKRLIERLPVPVRIWQGSADSSVPESNSILLFNSLMRGNSPVSLRLCTGAGHDLMATQYVREEAVDYFKRFISNQIVNG